MGLPAEFKELQIPGYVLKTLYVIAFFRDIFDAICPYIGLPRFIDYEAFRPEPTIQVLSTSASLAHELIPVVRCSDLLTAPEDCCTVCLLDFEADDKVRQLPNCRHVFHHRCLDRWIVEFCKMTCPICRNRFLPEEKYAMNNDYTDLHSVNSFWFVNDALGRTPNYL